MRKKHSICVSFFVNDASNVNKLYCKEKLFTNVETKLILKGKKSVIPINDINNFLTKKSNDIQDW